MIVSDAKKVAKA
jgi:hypothetical protein